MAGSWFRGRPMGWDADRQAIEQARQRLVMERLAAFNELILEMIFDPEQNYQIHRAEYERTGDLVELDLMLRYVR